MAHPRRLADVEVTAQMTVVDSDTQGFHPVVPSFAVISGAQVAARAQGQEKQVVELVEATYRLHGAGDSVNPPSYFLRFPDRPSARIIALPASIGGEARGRRGEVDLQLPAATSTPGFRAPRPC